MRVLTVTRSTPVERTPRVIQLEGLFDVPPADRSERTWTVSLPIEETDWRVGLIVGPSGSGKTTLAREAFPDAPFVTIGQGYDWPTGRAVVDGFPADLGIREVTAALSAVGFSSPPAWLRPFATLSTGEQFRATVARALVDPASVVVLDEFTSVVDRTVARVGAAAVGRAVRRAPGKRVVCVTCHDDVAEWLGPDWTLTLPDGAFARGSLRRPPIDLAVARVRHSAWDLFRRHHYLAAGLNRAAACFAAVWAGRPVAFVAVVPQYGRPAGWREHRCVCLPDFQGVGIGTAVGELVAGAYAATGRPYFSVTGHPALVRHRAGSPLWRMTRPPGRRAAERRAGVEARFARTRAVARVTASFRYAGPPRPAAARALGLTVRGEHGAHETE